MRRTKIARIFTLILVVMVMICGLTNVVAAPKYKFSLGHVGSSDDPRHTAVLKFAEALKEKTNGQATATIFPSSQLGTYEEMEEGLQMGTIDIVLESIGTLSRYAPVAGIESMPFLFRDRAHYDRIWKGAVGQEIVNKIAKDTNFLCLGFMYRGARQLTSNKAVNNASDLQGLKIRVSPMKERIVTWQVLGASPTPMSFSEVFTALDQGIIDAQENPLDVIYANSLHEVQKYLVLSSHMSNGYTFIFNNKKFNALPKNIQQAMRESIEVAEKWFNDYVQREADKILQQLKDSGMTVINPDIDSFVEQAKGVIDQFPDLK